MEINKRMAEHGAALINDGDTIIHHCNTGALATVDWGTALGVIRTAHEQGKKIHVLVDETRPRLQGARLTAWELEQYGIPYEIISDNMSGYFLKAGKAQKVSSARTVSPRMGMWRIRSAPTCWRLLRMITMCLSILLFPLPLLTCRSRTAD